MSPTASPPATTTSTYREVRDGLESVPPDRARRILNLLISLAEFADDTSITDSDLAKATGYSRVTVNKKRLGVRPITPDDLWRFSSALSVPVGIFWMTPKEAVDKYMLLRMGDFAWNHTFLKCRLDHPRLAR